MHAVTEATHPGAPLTVFETWRNSAHRSVLLATSQLRFRSLQAHGISIGSEMSAGISDVLFEKFSLTGASQVQI